ncbi:hypothetical protein E2C01_012313 [Portunus trituberculatus]|uniref:Uncharacterized protein n=1 Tax=Portunus trituberculatus TaxID=210409 RepID=A0A5B7DDI3_PORTR|nr:hypothetical protein [Portunus trituberculatus]
MMLKLWLLFFRRTGKVNRKENACVAKYKENQESLPHSNLKKTMHSCDQIKS